MRKFIVLSEAALLAGALAGGTQATPLSARGALATSSAFDQAMPDQQMPPLPFSTKRADGLL
jgi:hypothetical protein